MYTAVLISLLAVIMKTEFHVIYKLHSTFCTTAEIYAFTKLRIIKLVVSYYSKY